MCGIAGYLRLDGEAADPAILHAMCEVIRHRGPDGEGTLVEGPVALGMRRLAIIDVAGGDQPIHSADGDHSIVFNGEAYDFRRVRAELEAQGARFSTRSDTEVVLRAIERDGPDGIRRLRGMFGFAVWSRKERRLLLVRDRLGKKPLHYHVGPGHLLFGSEIKSILTAMARLRLPRPELSRPALAQYMAYGYVPDPLTIFAGIRRLPPGHRLVVQDGRVTVEPWWSLDPTTRFEGDDDEALHCLEEKLEEAVRLRLESEVPLGAFLSGGVDSSTIVALMSRVASGRVKTFSIGFEQADFDELRHARRVAEHLGTEHEEEIVRPDAAEIVDELVRHFDEPFADSSAIPCYYVAKMARREVTVALSGDGGDELFHGYSRYALTEGRGLEGLLPAGLRRIVFGGLARLLPQGAFGRARLWSLGLGEDERYLHHFTCGVSEWHRSLWTRSFLDGIEDSDPSPVYLEALRRHPALDATSRRAYADTMIYLPADVMTKVDRTSMMVSLEARAPLLDHHLVEFAAGLPAGMKRRNGESKWLLKRLARKLVPPEVVDRRKQGFGVPVAAWFNADWMARTDRLIDSQLERGFLRKDTIDRLRREHRQGRRDHSHLIWCLVVLELWMRLYVDDRAFGTA